MATWFACSQDRLGIQAFYGSQVAGNYSMKLFHPQSRRNGFATSNIIFIIMIRDFVEIHQAF